jgi:hypothetical protein
MKLLNVDSPCGKGILLCLALMFLLSGTAFPAGTDTETVESEGLAAIQGGNLAQAREQALSLALRGAIEKTLATALTPQILAARKSTLAERVYPVTDRYILGYRIVREAEQDGSYLVKIAATVDAGGLKGDLRRLGVLASSAGEERAVPGHSVEIVGRGAFASHHDFLAFRDLVAGLPSVRAAVPQYLSADRFVMSLESAEGAQGLARELSKKRFKGAPVRVLRVEGASVEIAIQSHGGSRD